MTFKVDLSEVNGMADKIKATSNVLEKDLHNVTRQLDELITLDSFQGTTASNAKSYFENVHQTAIQSIQLIANQLASNIHMHIDTFNEDVDSSDGAKIEYNYLKEVKENIQTHHVNIEDSVQNIAHTIDGISDIITIDHPSLSDIQTSKNNADQTIDQLTNNVELFTEKGTDQDAEMKEMLHHLKALIAEASSKKGEARFANVQSSSIVQPLSFLDEANKVLRTSQTEKQKEVMLEKKQETFGKMSEMMEDSTLSVKYEKKPNTIVEISQVLLDIVKGTSSAVYHLAEDFVQGTIQILEDIPGTLEAIGSMIAQPIDTVKYIGNVVIESFNRDVIHGGAESRAHWFTYAAGSIFGFKGLGNAGKAGAQAAKQGVQKAGQKLDELLPYHPKHQLAIDGPVPYNVYDGNFFKDQLMVKVENVSSKGIDNTKLSPSNYPNPDPPMSIPPVRYEPKTIEEVVRMRQGKGPTTKMTHGDKNIEAHHRQQVPIKNDGILDELEQRTHRGGGNHTRHDKPSQLTPSKRAKEIREHYKERGKEYILPGEGI